MAELGGDPAELLRAAGIRSHDVGEHEVFLAYRSLIVAVETAATATATPDFGRRLALRQDIEILGPLGVAARTAATVGDAFTIVETFLAAYSPAISARITADRTSPSQQRASPSARPISLARSTRTRSPTTRSCSTSPGSPHTNPA